jgi:hypothetical protein
MSLLAKKNLEVELVSRQMRLLFDSRRFYDPRRFVSWLLYSDRHLEDLQGVEVASITTGGKQYSYGGSKLLD